MTEVLLNKLDFEPVLKPGFKVHILPDNQYGWFELPHDQVPEILPRQIVNMASFTNRLAVLADSGQQSTLRDEVDQLDMPDLELAQLRAVVLDDVLVKVFQPAAVGRFPNKTGPLQLSKGESDLNYRDKDSQLAEIYIFEDNTRPTIEVQNTGYRQTAFARIAFFGYRYPLKKLKSPPPEGTPAFTLTVSGQSQN